MTRKRRTRSHVIADLSTNFVERQILLCGHSAQRVETDYGYDLEITTFDENGEFENGLIYLQLKATDSLTTLRNGDISFQLESKDIEMWYNEIYPVFVILYDAIQELAYWLDIQSYLRDRNINADHLVSTQESFTVHFNPDHLVDLHAIEGFRDKKNRLHNFLFRMMEQGGREDAE